MKQKKQFEHERFEVCQLSQEKIDTSSGEYAIILDCIGDKIESVGFYKRSLLRDVIKGNMQRMAQVLQNKYTKIAGSMLQKIGVLKQ